MMLTLKPFISEVRNCKGERHSPWFAKSLYNSCQLLRCQVETGVESGLGSGSFAFLAFPKREERGRSMLYVNKGCQPNTREYNYAKGTSCQVNRLPIVGKRIDALLPTEQYGFALISGEGRLL